MGCACLLDCGKTNRGKKNNERWTHCSHVWSRSESTGQTFPRQNTHGHLQTHFGLFRTHKDSHSCPARVRCLPHDTPATTHCSIAVKQLFTCKESSQVQNAFDYCYCWTIVCLPGLIHRRSWTLHSQLTLPKSALQLHLSELRTRMLNVPCGVFVCRKERVKRELKDVAGDL